jgi:ABC-type sugar transport system permease subunit
MNPLLKEIRHNPLLWLLIFVPVVFVAAKLKPEAHTLLFVLSILAILPLTILLSGATEAVAARTGDAVGGLLNATLGNLAEFVIALAALRAGQYTLVKASIAGPIVANALFILGASFLIGGLKHHVQEFNRVSARLQAGLLFLATVALLIPSAVSHADSMAEVAFTHRLSVGLAVLLNRRFPGRAIFRLLFFLPYVLSEAITGIVFSLLLQPDALVDTALQRVGLEGLIQDWLGNTDIVMITLFVIISWKYFGFHMILLLAGLQGIPREIEEAALIDGAGRWQAFRYVTLPLIGPTLRVSVFLSVIGALQLFDIVWVMTGGGPLNASTTMAVNMFKTGFEKQQMGYGSAFAVLLFLCALVVALLYQRFVLRRDIDGAVTAYNG